MTVQVALTGKHQGKTVMLAGVNFKDGLADIPATSTDHLNMLANFYEVHPVRQLELVDGKLQLINADLGRIASIEDIPGAKTSKVLEEKLDKIAEVPEEKPKAKK